MLRKSEANRSRLLFELSLGICKVSFRKVSNGQFRTIYCTLKKEMIPEKYHDTIQLIIGEQNLLDVLPIYDIKEKAWKSFYIPRLNVFLTTEDLSKEKII
jgi:hypothetical protein